MLLWFHDWVSGKLVDFVSPVTSVLFFVVSVLGFWLCVCVCVFSCLVDLGVYVIDSLQLAYVEFGLCCGCLALCASIVGLLLSMLANYEEKFALTDFLMSAFLSENRVSVFRRLGRNSASLFLGLWSKNLFCPETTTSPLRNIT